MMSSSSIDMNKYIASPYNLKSKLAEYGVAIVPGVLEKIECELMMSDMWDYLEHVTANLPTPINRNNPASWVSFRHLWPKHSMLVQHWGIGNSQLVWNVRQNPKVIAPFEVIWDKSCDELISSFDGASFHLPPEKYGTGDQGWFRQLWMHTDQSYVRSRSSESGEPIDNMECIQGWVTANDVGEGDATLALLEGSHSIHGEFAKVFDIKDKTDWYKLSQDELKWYREDKKCQLVKIRCNAGDMVLWDSRTIHCGVEPVRGRMGGANIRNVVYTCYSPRCLASPQVLDKKIKAHKEMRTTNHWPHRPKLFPKHPRTYGQPIANIQLPPPPILSPLGYILAGYGHTTPH